MGSYSIKVVRSKTAIVPVNSSLLPRTEEEHERCKRTAYVTNIDLDVEARPPAAACLSADVNAGCGQAAEVCSFFETLCGAVTRLHLTKLDNQDTQVAFVEFATTQSADRALSCGGARIKARRRRPAPLHRASLRPHCDRRSPSASAHPRRPCSSLATTQFLAPTTPTTEEAGAAAISVLLAQLASPTNLHLRLLLSCPSRSTSNRASSAALLGTIYCYIGTKVTLQ